MQKLLLNKNTIYNLTIHISILLFNFIILYCFIYDIHNIWFFLLMLPNLIICTIMICIFEFIKNNQIRAKILNIFKNKKIEHIPQIKEKKIPEQKIKIIDTLKIYKFCAILMIFCIIFHQIYFFPFSLENGLMLCIPFLVFILYESSAHKNPKLVIDYNEKFLYFNDEKISFEEIKEYSVSVEELTVNITIYLTNNKNLNYYSIGAYNTLNTSLLMNLENIKYLKL